MNKSAWIPITDLDKIDPDSVDWDKLREAMRSMEENRTEPHISIWYDKIGTEIHFDDGSFSCRDFGGNDTEVFILLMRAISIHNWKKAIEFIGFLSGE